jgi:uncharacterized protein involved in type VI secretion and phage assembly
MEAVMVNLIQTLPEVLVSVEGARLSPAELLGLESVLVQQRLSMPALCELVFRNYSGSSSNPAALTAGTSITVALQEHDLPLFSGTITAVERRYGPSGEREVRVRGYDRLHQLRRQQSLRAFVQINAAELAREMVAGLGLSVQYTDTGPLWQTLIQHQDSDFELLNRVTAPYGLYLLLEGNTLHLLPLTGTGERIPIRLGETLLEARIETNTAFACDSLRFRGWDPLSAESFTADAGGAGLPDALEAAVGWQSGYLGGAMHDARHSEQLAQSEYERRAAREQIFWGIAEGSPSLRPGVTAVTSGGDAHMDGEYVITAAKHTIELRRGYITEISSMPPERVEMDPSARVTLGEVTSVDDPQNLGRVRVKLPTYSEMETGWLQVLSAGAGPGKGLVALPDTGDRVLVLFVQANPGLALVLGGLYGMGGPEDSGVDGGSVRRYTFHTSGGQRIRLDDARGVIRCENSQGSYIELGPDTVRIYAATDLDITAPGRSVTIRGNSIDFERA